MLSTLVIISMNIFMTFSHKWLDKTVSLSAVCLSLWLSWGLADWIGDYMPVSKKIHESVKRAQLLAAILLVLSGTVVDSRNFTYITKLSSSVLLNGLSNHAFSHLAISNTTYHFVLTIFHYMIKRLSRILYHCLYFYSHKFSQLSNY